MDEHGVTESFTISHDIINTNNDSNTIIQQLNQASDFIKKYFFANKEVIRFSLQFNKRFSFEKVQNRLWQQGKQAERYNSLLIKLIVEIFQEDSGAWKQVHRVHSFLNEAQLTRIAIGIRIGALRTRVQTTDFKMLVRDDMLISLDMSNRMPIVKMILNLDNNPDLSFFDSFQKIILTHDKAPYRVSFHGVRQRHPSCSVRFFPAGCNHFQPALQLQGVQQGGKG